MWRAQRHTRTHQPRAHIISPPLVDARRAPPPDTVGATGNGATRIAVCSSHTSVAMARSRHQGMISAVGGVRAPHPPRQCACARARSRTQAAVPPPTTVRALSHAHRRTNFASATRTARLIYGISGRAGGCTNAAAAHYTGATLATVCEAAARVLAFGPSPAGTLRRRATCARTHPRRLGARRQRGHTHTMSLRSVGTTAMHRRRRNAGIGGINRCGGARRIIAAARRP